MPNTIWHEKREPDYSFLLEQPRSTLSEQELFRASNVVAVVHQPKLTLRTIYVANRHQLVERLPGVSADLSGIAENLHYADYVRLLL